MTIHYKKNLFVHKVYKLCIACYINQPRQLHHKVKLNTNSDKSERHIRLIDKGKKMSSSFNIEQWSAISSGWPQHNTSELVSVVINRPCISSDRILRKQKCSWKVTHSCVNKQCFAVMHSALCVKMRTYSHADCRKSQEDFGGSGRQGQKGQVTP